MTFWQRISLGLRVIFGRYDAPTEKYYYHPKYSPSEVLLRHKAFPWDTPLDRQDLGE